MQSASFRLPLPAHMVSLRDLFTPHLSQHARLLSIDTALPDAALVVERFSGREAVNTLFRLEIDCLAGNAHFELKRLLGEEVTLRLLLADGTHRHWHGYVTSAMSLGADGGLARYRIIVEPWLAFTAQRQNCLQFQDVDVLGVLDTVFGAYDVAHWRSEITQPLRNYSRITQFRETEFSFITRLLAEEGIASSTTSRPWPAMKSPTAGTPSSSSTAPPKRPNALSRSYAFTAPTRPKLTTPCRFLVNTGTCSPMR